MHNAPRTTLYSAQCTQRAQALGVYVLRQPTPLVFRSRLAAQTPRPFDVLTLKRGANRMRGYRTPGTFGIGTLGTRTLTDIFEVYGRIPRGFFFAFAIRCFV